MQKDRSKSKGEEAVFHLCGTRAIASMFNVGRATVAKWKRRGAPIKRVGKSYQAQYAELWDWLKQENAS